MMCLQEKRTDTGVPGGLQVSVTHTSQDMEDETDGKRENFERIGIYEKESSEHSGPGDTLSDMKNPSAVSVAWTQGASGAGDRATGNVHAGAQRRTDQESAESRTEHRENARRPRGGARRGQRREHGTEVACRESFPEPTRDFDPRFQAAPFVNPKQNAAAHVNIWARYSPAAENRRRKGQS